MALLSPICGFSQNVEVQGAIKIVDGMQGINKVLTSDGDGLANWQTPFSATPTYYQSVNICSNSWMTKNLDVDKYRNGDPIPHVADTVVWAT